jgi:hypothetical protein
MISRVYIAASSRDSRFARICAASVRAFYPEIPIFLLPGGKLERGLAEELRIHWDVQLAEIPSGNYGWGFVKLEPLFGRPAAPFLMLDADTVMTGPVLDEMYALLSMADAPAFLVDEEDQSEAEMRRLYYDWDRLRTIDPEVKRPTFVFNSGQWVGTPGVISREDFDPWVEWAMPPKLRHADVFMPGDQGILNYLLNQGHAAQRFSVERLPLMRWPGHGLNGFSSEEVRTGIAPKRVIHWAGMKRLRFADMKGADLLTYFEKLYYTRIPGGRWKLHARAIASVFREFVHQCRVRLRLFWLHKIRRGHRPN